MKTTTPILLIALLVLLGCSNGRMGTTQQADRILKIKMHLSAFGVESDNFPNIDALLDFEADSSYCKRYFYAPPVKETVYKLSTKEMETVKALLKIPELKKLPDSFATLKTDQPSSTTIIYTSQDTLTFKDYGLEGAQPLQKLYEIVYKYQ